MKVEQLLENQRPLIWDLVADLLADGKRVLYHGRIPGSGAYHVGLITKVEGDRVFFRKAGRFAETWFAILEHDDKRLVLRPSNDPEMIDFTVEENK